MLVDFSSFYWIEDKDKNWLLGVVGTVVLVDVRRASDIKDPSFLSSPERMIKDFGYVAYFNGIAPEMDEDYQLSEFPVMYPIIGQSIDLDNLKLNCIKYVNIVFGADRPSKLEVSKAMSNEEEALRGLVKRFMNITGYNNEMIN